MGGGLEKKRTVPGLRRKKKNNKEKIAAEDKKKAAQNVIKELDRNMPAKQQEENAG